MPKPKPRPCKPRPKGGGEEELMALILRKTEENAIKLFDATGSKPTPLFESWLSEG